MVGFVCDGAPAMTGKSNGVILHQEALCVKSLKITHVMDIVVK
jgi:hypothetical protein